MSDGIGTTTFTYTQMGQLASETGPWASDTISCTYIDRLRQSLNLQQPNGSAWVGNYGYDVANRMKSVTSAAGLFQYSYNAGLSGTDSSALVGGISLPNGGFITNTFDGNARMTGTWLYNSGAIALDYAGYTYNQGNQRTVAIREEPNSISNNYTYDKIGEVTGDQAYQESGTPRLNEQLTYAFDPAGNLNYRTNNALIQNFRVNSVNELTTNTNGGTLTVVGTTTSQAASVTVNGINASNYSDATFAATNLALTTTYTAVANDSYGRSSTSTVNVSISTNVGFHYDGNGNLTNDGLRNFVYDDENELIQVSVSNQWMSQFSYDGKMRRRIRNEFTWQGSWVQTNEVYYVYDGNLVIQERDINNLPTVTYTRGKDLSGGLEGAGGIGGLLARTAQAYVDAPLAGHSFYHSDANGNITMLIDSSQGIVAKYLYDAFGNTISASGLLANANVYRFSSKEWHQNSGLSYYLYRYYDPNLQRWLNRDPIGEAGGINLYQAMRNNPLRWVDPFGLTTYVWPPENTPPGTYGPTATVVNDGSDAVLPAIPYLTDSQGLGSTDLDFLPFFLPEIPAVSKALDAVGDALGNAAKGALDKMGLGKPKPPVKCPPPKPPGWKPDWEKGISSRSNGPKGKPGGESWWPPEGGEWHFHDTDPWHPDAHWDYNPWDSYVSPWQNIDQQGNVIPKK